ncbi:MAG: ABC transporter family substrate-binding protein, partial [Aeromicrobium sp.]|uniref:ABC transporter family substrate-binding protein n=1 Tax=Aeromicrobium sp. TaxID=1871063 RepID=UPI003C51557C
WSPPRVPVRRPWLTVRSSRRLMCLLATSILVAGCSLLPGDGDSPQDPPSARVPDLTPVGWEPVDRERVAAGGTLRLATPALPENFNPQHSSNGESEVDRLLDPTVGSAVRITADGGWEVDPDYAREVEIVDRKPLTIRVEMNRKAVWQDGTPIVARDMVAFWKAQNGSDPKFEVRSTQGFDEIDDVTPDGKFAYTVTFDAPTTDWPRYIYPALPASVSDEAETFNAAFADRPIPSNGPFRVASIDRDTGQVVQERNPQWWGTKPRLKQITWQAATPEIQLEALRAGDLDATDVSSSQLADIDDAELDEDVVVQRATGTEWTQLTMNGAAGPLKDVAVRRAVALALDRRALADALTKPLGTPSQVLGSFVLLPGQRGYVDQSDLIAPDVAKAGQLLDDAGWEMADTGTVRTLKGKALTLDMPVPAKTSTSRTRAAMIADQLAEVGIKVTLQTVPDDEFFTNRIIPLDFDLATFTHQGGAFPVVDTKRLFYPIDSGQNFTGVEDDKLASVWDKAISALDDDDRAKAIEVLDKRLFGDVPLVPLGVVPQFWLTNRSIANYGPAQFLGPDWTSVGFRAAAGD